MTNEKPGGHGDRAHAAGGLDMAVWDAVAKIAGKPLWKLLSERFNGGQARRDVSWSIRAAATTTPARSLKACAPRCAATRTRATGW